jgi:hypothetical protein
MTREVPIGVASYSGCAGLPGAHYVAQCPLCFAGYWARDKRLKGHAPAGFGYVHSSDEPAGCICLNGGLPKAAIGQETRLPALPPEGSVTRQRVD